MAFATHIARSTTAPSGAVWRLLVDLPRQTEWDAALERVEFAAQFQNGARGRMKPRGAPAAAFELADVVPERSYAKVQRLPGARMRFFHLLEAEPGGGTRVTFSCEIDGPLSFLFGALFGGGIRRGQHAAIEALCARAEGAG